jgi:hypothetical protein
MDGAPGVVKATDAELGEHYLYCEGNAPLLFTENETNTERIFGAPNRTPYLKDGINNHVVGGQPGVVNPSGRGTKVAPHYRLSVGPAAARGRPAPAVPRGPRRAEGGRLRKSFDEIVQTRRREADEFYASVIPKSLDADQANVMRQALAGMLWSKQFYHYDVDQWLDERGSNPFKPTRRAAPRNDRWHHMYNGDVISMPDKWEYPGTRRGTSPSTSRPHARRSGLRQGPAPAHAA